MPYRREIGVSTVDAMGQTTAIHALALSLAKCLAPEQISRLGLLLIQLGTTLDTIAALEEFNVGEENGTVPFEKLDLTGNPSAQNTGGYPPHI